MSPHLDVYLAYTCRVTDSSPPFHFLMSEPHMMIGKERISIFIAYVIIFMTFAIPLLQIVEGTISFQSPRLTIYHLQCLLSLTPYTQSFDKACNEGKNNFKKICASLNLDIMLFRPSSMCLLPQSPKGLLLKCLFPLQYTPVKVIFLKCKANHITLLIEAVPHGAEDQIILGYMTPGFFSLRSKKFGAYWYNKCNSFRRHSPTSFTSLTLPSNY